MKWFPSERINLNVAEGRREGRRGRRGGENDQLNFSLPSHDLYTPGSIHRSRRSELSMRREE